MFSFICVCFPPGCPQEKVRRFYQKLASMLSHKNNRMVIFSLSALTSLCLNEDFGEKVRIYTTVTLLTNVGSWEVKCSIRACVVKDSQSVGSCRTFGASVKCYTL